VGPEQTLAATVGSNIDISNLSAPQSECTIVINPASTNNLLAGSNYIIAGGSMLAYWSTNSGASWQSVVLPLSLSNGHSYNFASDPAVAFDLNGNGYYAYLLIKNNQINGALGVSKSTDGGKTWSNPVPIADNFSGRFVPFEDKEMMAVDTVVGSPFTNNIYVAWDRNEVDGTQTVRISRSTDGGASFNAPVRVDDPATSSGSVIYATPAVGTNGELYVVWNDYVDTTASSTNGFIKIDRSTNGGLTWGTDRVVASNIVVNLFYKSPSGWLIPAQPDRGIAASPSIAVDTSSGSRRGNVYVVWCDAVNGIQTNNIDIFFSRSTDRGQTWSARKRVNDDSTTTSQFMPWLAVDPVDGTIHISWYDCRDDTNNKKTHIYYTRSTDGGDTFEPNIRVTTVQSDESVDNAARNNNNYGDYTGLAARNGRAFPVWTDTRRFANSLAEEIFTAQITQSPPPPAPAPVVTNVVPACGSTAGGTSVTIGGSNFQSGATIQIGGVSASNVVFISATTLTAISPTNSAGTKHIVVTNPDAQSDTFSNSFTYVSPPPAPTITTPSGGFCMNATNVSAFTVAGTAQATASVKIFAGATEMAAVLANGGGNWSTNLNFSSQSDGPISLTAVETNSCSGASPASSAVNGTKDILPPTFAGIASVTSAVEGATLTWSAASDASAVTYKIFQSTTSGGQNFNAPALTTNTLSAFISPLDPGTNSAITYFFVVRATDACGNSDSNSVELSVQPLLDPAKDQDGDGMSNGYEQSNDLNPFDPSDASGDSDGDGFTNLQEFIAGTSPTSAEDAPKISQAAQESDGFHVRFPTVSGRTYQVQRNDDLVSGSWTDVGATIAGDGTEKEIVDATADTTVERFYRVIVTSP
jgi:hypothetical protein